MISFGDTALLVESMDDGPRSGEVHRRAAPPRSCAAMARRWRAKHSSAVYVSVYLEVNARLQKQAMDMCEPWELPHRRGGGQGCHARPVLRHQAGVGELVPAGRAALPAGTKLYGLRLTVHFPLPCS